MAIDTLHITSWDDDHCEAGALDWILANLKPSRIETPGYTHDTANASKCRALIQAYKARRSSAGKTASVIPITPQYILGLGRITELGYQDILYHPKTLYDGSNNNSTVKLFRTGCFNVLSMGDVEHDDIGALLKQCRHLRREVDVLLVPHHGGKVDFMTKDFLDELKPSIAICTANASNQHSHPHRDTTDLFTRHGIPLMTTRRGDVLIHSTGGALRQVPGSRPPLGRRVDAARGRLHRPQASPDDKERRHHQEHAHAEESRAASALSTRTLAVC